MFNKHGHLDVRNTLSTWSFIKWIGDTAIVVAGGGILAHQPVEVFSLVFILWLWTLLKEVVDMPLVIAWLIGKIAHIRRKRKRRHVKSKH